MYGEDPAKVDFEDFFAEVHSFVVFFEKAVADNARRKVCQPRGNLGALR